MKIFTLIQTALALLLATTGSAQNGTLYATDFNGADFGQRVGFCMAALPSVGGVCDSGGLSGAQSSSDNITIPPNVTLRLGPTILTMAPEKSVVGGHNSEIVGLSGLPDRSQLIGTVAGDGVVRVYGTMTIRDVEVQNLNTSAVGSAAVHVDGTKNGSYVHIYNSGMSGGVNGLRVTGGSYYNAFNDDHFGGTASGYAVYLDGANANEFSAPVSIGKNLGCFDIENSQGITINHIDCEGVTQATIGLALSQAGYAQVIINGGYLQPADGAAIYLAPNASANVLNLGVWHFGYNTGCLGHGCPGILSIQGFGAPINNGAMALGSSTLGGADQELAIKGGIGIQFLPAPGVTDWWLGLGLSGSGFGLGTGDPFLGWTPKQMWQP